MSSINNPSAYEAPYDTNYSHEGRNSSTPDVTSATLPTVTVVGQRIKPSMKVLLTGGGGLVRFEASAPISESRVANYEGFNIVHLPTSLWAYRNTNGRHFSITGKLVSRTPNEATANAGYLTTVRSWVLPDFGNSGAPPPLIKLSGYSNMQLTEIPCIVLSYNWTFPDDVDYIWGSAEPMPVIGVLSIELEEAYSAEQITNQDWLIEVQGGGSFSNSGAPYSAKASAGGAGAMPVPFGHDWKGIAAGKSPGTFQTVGGKLENSPSPDSIAVNPTASSSTIGAAANSPEISSNENYSNEGRNNQVSDYSNEGRNNRFIAGSSSQQVLNNSVNPDVNKFVGVVVQVIDNYARSQGLAIPAIPKF
jgi:hypothetical protein